MDASPSNDSLRADWVFELANRWQVAAGLRQGKRRTDLAQGLADFLLVPSAPRTPVERLILRGYYLEVERAVTQAALRCRDAEVRLRLQRLLDTLEQPGLDPAVVETYVRDAVDWLRDTSLRSQPDLADRARAALDHWKDRRLSLERLARRLQSNVRYVRRSFTRKFGLSPAEYLRQHRTNTVIQALRAHTASEKELAREIGCAEVTVRRLVRAATGRTPRQIRAREIISTTARTDSPRSR